MVMPVYNGEKYLREAIDSILAQTFTDWEFIIVNEFGSNDAATDILKEYAARDARVRLLQNQTRLGIAESLNVGIRAAKGEYIARMDADDISGPERLQKQVEYLDAHSDVGLLGIHPTVFGEERWDWYTEYAPEQITANALFFLPCLHPTVMMRKSVLEEHGLLYNPEYRCTEDYDLFERILQYTKAGNLDDQELFRYRRYPTAATYAHVDDGNEVYRKVMSRALQRLSLSFSEEELSLLYIHGGCKEIDKKKLAEAMTRLDLLLKQIFQKNLLEKRFCTHKLFHTLHKRWKHMWECDIQAQYSWGKIPEEIAEVYQRSIFAQDTFCTPFEVEAGHIPRVTILMPSYNGEKYIYETIKSLEDQSFCDWELLIVNDPSTDNTVSIIQEYQKYDERIRLIVNEVKAGLAEALNQGIREARGEYIARIDDDDIAMPSRLEKQVRLLEERADVSLVGSWQRHFGKEEWVHRPPETPEEIKAALLFKCDVCHSTIMFKKENFTKRGLYYSPNYVSEDYELWTRAIRELKFYTIPEVLGEYRVNGENITASKLDKLETQQREIIARTLKELLHIHVPQSDMILLSGWENPFFDGGSGQKQLREREETLLQKIEKQNGKYRAYDPAALKATLNQRREWAGIIKPTKQSRAAAPKRTMKQRLKGFIKRLLKPLYHPFRWRYEDRLLRIESSVSQLAESVKYLQKTVQDLDGHLYDYYDYLTASIQGQDAQIKRLQAELGTAQAAVIAGVDKRALKAEQTLIESTDARIWKAEQALTASTDARIWKAEQALTASMDARIWKAEQVLITNAESEIKKRTGFLLGKLSEGLNIPVKLVDVLYANDTFNTYHHGSSATSHAILKMIQNKTQRVECIPMPDICENVSIYPSTIIDFTSDEFFGAWKEQNYTLVEAISRSKQIVVNGEGCLSAYCPGTLNLLYFIHVAQSRYKKPCSLINHSLCVRDIMGRNAEEQNVNVKEFKKIIELVYSNLHFSAVREQKSLDELKQMLPNGRFELSFDCMALYVQNFYSAAQQEKHYITISGGNALPENYVDIVGESLNVLKGIYKDAEMVFLFSDIPMSNTTTDMDVYKEISEKSAFPIRLISVKTTQEWLNIIESSCFLISGRFHHSIAAFMLDTPFAAFPTDTHKLESALEMMGCSDLLLNADIDKETLVKKIEKICERGSGGLFDKSKRRELLELAQKNFDGIQTEKGVT